MDIFQGNFNNAKDINLAERSATIDRIVENAQQIKDETEEVIQQSEVTNITEEQPTEIITENIIEVENGEEENVVQNTEEVIAQLQENTLPAIEDMQELTPEVVNINIIEGNTLAVDTLETQTPITVDVGTAEITITPKDDEFSAEVEEDGETEVEETLETSIETESEEQQVELSDEEQEARNKAFEMLPKIEAENTLLKEYVNMLVEYAGIDKETLVKAQREGRTLKDYTGKVLIAL